MSEDGCEYITALVQTVREPLLVLDGDVRIQQANPEFYKTFRLSRGEAEGRSLYEIGNGQFDFPELRQALAALLAGKEPLQGIELQHDFPQTGGHKLRVRANYVGTGDGAGPRVLLAIEDATERQDAEVRFQRLFETAKDGIVIVDVDTGAVEEVNGYLLHMTGLRREDVIGKTLSRAGREVGLDHAEEILYATAAEEIVRRDDLLISSRSGGQIPVEVVANRYTVGNRSVVQLNVRDITGRKKAAQALEESEARFRLFVESVRDYAMFQLNAQGEVVSWNSGAERLLGWQESEVLGRSASLIFIPEDVARGEPERELETALLKGCAEDERWHIRKDGSRFFASGVMTAVRDSNHALVGFAKVMRDITARRKHEQEVQRSLEEKTMLVREIHHRVKNNLQVIISLLSLKADYTTDSEVVAAFEEAQGRVRAIARIHEQLYASEDLSEVEIGTYLTFLVRDLIALYTTSSSVTLTLQVQNIVVHIEQAIPLGLIAHELIVNSLKHGLKSGIGHLRITLGYVDGGPATQAVQLRVQDDGPGLPADLNLAGTRTMGFHLIYVLVRQLAAQFDVGPGPGANLSVTFPLKTEPDEPGQEAL